MTIDTEHDEQMEHDGLLSVASDIAVRYQLSSIQLLNLAQFRALRFVDMPGLESTFAHNTETALNWLPKVGLALVAISVDQPLSQHDIALLKSLYEYTPKVSILLTKVDLLTDGG